MSNTNALKDELRSKIAEIRPGLRLNYVEAGSGVDTIVLLHGWPQTWWEWRHVIRPLAEKRFRVVAPDYRGAGDSSKPRDGYDKFTMATDIALLLTEHLGVTGHVKLVGHDLGMQVAYALVRQFPELVEQLVLMEAPLPGTRVWYETIAAPKLAEVQLWHFHFHNGWNDVADLLTFGRERQYLQGFYTYLAYNHEAIGPADVDRYVTSYTSPGAMRAGIDLFRAFDRDAEDNRAALQADGRVKLPVLGMGGASSFYVRTAKEMLDEVAEDVRVVSIPECGHWIAEEQPDVFVAEILKFFGPARRMDDQR